MSLSAISTSCIRICQIDPVMGLCIGCGRTTHEIGLWSRLSEPERQSVMAALPERMKTASRERARVMRERRKAN